MDRDISLWQSKQAAAVPLSMESPANTAPATTATGLRRGGAKR